MLAIGPISTNEASLFKFINQSLFGKQSVFRTGENIFHGRIPILTCPSPPHPKKG